MASNIAARTVCRSLAKGKLTVLSRIHVRGFSASPDSGYTHDEPLHPNHTINSKPPKYWGKPEGEREKEASRE
jgi:hypothetical protein